MESKILFGNNFGYIINDYITKKKIIDYLIEHVQFYKFNSKEIVSINDLNNIKNNKYCIYPNIIGSNYLFLAKKINNLYYCVLIDYKNLTDEMNINYNNIKIISLKIRLKEYIYDGTIFDGRLVSLGGTSVYIINNCFILENTIINLKDINEGKLTNFIENSIIIDHEMNSIYFKMNKLYELSEINNLVNNKIKNSRFKITSLNFIPINDNIKYTFTLCKISERNIEEYFYAKYIKSDVVILYALESTNKKKIGIAHIPNLKCSKLCKKNISKENFTIIKCKLNILFKKWEPIEIIFNDNIKIANYQNTIDNVRNIVPKY